MDLFKYQLWKNSVLRHINKIQGLSKFHCPWDVSPPPKTNFFDNFWKTYPIEIKLCQYTPHIDQHLLAKFLHHWWSHCVTMTSLCPYDDVPHWKCRKWDPLVSFFHFHIFCSNFVWKLHLADIFWAQGLFCATCSTRVFYRPVLFALISPKFL